MPPFIGWNFQQVATLSASLRRQILPHPFKYSIRHLIDQRPDSKPSLTLSKSIMAGCSACLPPFRLKTIRSALFPRFHRKPLGKTSLYPLVGG